jgi:hypothetical protein
MLVQYTQKCYSPDIISYTTRVKGPVEIQGRLIFIVHPLSSFVTEPVDPSGRTSKDGGTFPPKRRYPSTGLHGVITQKTIIQKYCDA